MKKLIYILAIAAMSAACQQEINDDMTLGAQDTVLDCLPATLNVKSSVQTKTSLVTSGDEKGSVLWSTGDAVSAFLGSDGNSKYTLDDSSNGSTNGTFNQTSGVVGAAINGNVLLYPYAADATVSMSQGAATVNFALPATQAYKADSFESGAYPMIAVSESAEGFAMKNVLGILEVALHCEFAASVSKIEFVADVPVCGAASVTASVEGEPSLVLTDSQSKTVTLNCKTPVTLSNDKTAKTKFYIALPAQKYEGFTLKVYDTNGYQMIETTSNTLDLKRSKVKTISLEYIIDLHAKGYANCYVLAPTTFCKYRFDATVIGNGSAGLISGAHTESVNIAPKSAKLLYKFGSASVANTSENQAAVNTPSVSLDSKGRVVFKSPSETNGTGNAIIAVYSGEECTGDILWSWHIWKPSDAIADQNYSGTYTLMDRNLGSCFKSNTSNNANGVSGAYYQWGRKDPYFTNAGNGSALSSPYNVGRNTSCGSIGVSIRFPQTFYKYESNTDSYGTTHTDKDWLPNDGHNDGLWAAVKTIYDPCPAGYRVADVDAFKNLTSSISETGPTNGFTYDLTSFSGVAGIEHYWYGYITEYGKRSGRNADAYVWTVGVDGVNAKSFYYKKDDTHTNPKSCPRTTGAAVRCQKIQ